MFMIRFATYLVRPEGLEPPTLWSEAKCSNPLSYGRKQARTYHIWSYLTTGGIFARLRNMDQASQRRQLLLTFLSEHPTAVIATADKKGNPAAAVILFAEVDNLTLLFGTHPTKKYENLVENPKVALAMTKDLRAVQYHGYAEPLGGEEVNQAKALFAKKHPSMTDQLVEGSIFFRITPTWLRYIDMNVQPWEQWELRFPEPDWFHS